VAMPTAAILHRLAALVSNMTAGRRRHVGNWKMRLITAITISVLASGYAHSASDQNKPASTANQNKPASASNQNKPASAPNQDQTAAGFWAQVGGDGEVGGWFFFIERNGLYEGRLVKMFKRPGEQQLIDTCQRCAGDQKNAPMLGLTIVKGMRRNGSKYEDGSILDPRDGSVYHAQMELSPDGQKLSVRGYLGIPLLGQTQVWNRLPDNTMEPIDIPKESLAPD
jgi:uncharacterized protein (DUF2147 family)